MKTWRCGYARGGGEIGSRTKEGGAESADIESDSEHRIVATEAVTTPLAGSRFGTNAPGAWWPHAAARTQGPAFGAAPLECDAQLADPTHIFPVVQHGIPEHASEERAEDACGACAAKNRSVVSQMAAERMTIQSSTAWSARVIAGAALMAT